MGGLKKIMYGVTDFPLMRKENAYFVDRTALIRDLEAMHYAMFLRPRRFGKSLLCAILKCYYDIDYADRFEALFGGLDIGESEIFETMRTWYDNYRFSPDVVFDVEGKECVPPRVANPTLVLYFMQYFLQTHRPPRELVDRNLRTDYMKIRHIITEGRRVNGNYHRLEDIITALGTSAVLQDSFQAKELGKPDNFVSFLFYNGLVTVTDSGALRTRLGIPNQTVGEFLHDFIGRAYE